MFRWVCPAGIELAAGMPGAGDPPGRVRAVRCEDLAALVSEVDCPGPLGLPGDRTVHKKTLDANAAGLPVLPRRCGGLT